MKVFIWETIQELTDSYHSDGGLVVIAESVDVALAEAMKLGVVFSKEEEQIPDKVYELAGDAKPDVFIFPNAGCC